MNDISKKIVELFCSKFKNRINEKETYEDYISSFTKSQIERLLKINAIIADDNAMLAHVLAISIHKKNHVVNEFEQNIKDIYSNILKGVTENEIKQLEIYLKEYKYSVLNIDLSTMKYSLHFIDFLNENCIAKVNYLKRENSIVLYTPVEIRQVLKSILKNSKIKKECKKNSLYKNNLHNLIATYGIMSVNKMAYIYNNIYEKIDEDNIIQKIMISQMFDDDIRLGRAEKEFIVYGSAFEDIDDALNFYDSLPKNLDYKIYTKNEYNEIGKGIYHHNFKDYMELSNFLALNLNMTGEEIYNFDDIFVLDYMFSFQVDENVAKKNLNKKLEKEFIGLDINDKAYISKLILSIAKNYPNFHYKGYTYNEIKNLVK